MRIGGLSHLAILATFLLVAPSLVYTSDLGNSPYTIIPERNVFGLNKRPPPPSAEPTNPPPPKLTLLGIANVFGTRKAVLRPGEPGKPVPAAKAGEDTTLVLEEGVSAQGVKVVKIDDKAGVVVVNNNGEEVKLDFETHGVKQPTGPAAPVGAPGVPGLPGAVPGLPGGLPQAIPPPAFGVPRPAGATAANVPGLPGTVPAAASRAVTPQTDFSAGVATAIGTGTTPTRPVRGQEKPLTPEEEMILIEANRERYKTMKNPPPLPPTPLTPYLDQSANPSQPPAQTAPPGLPAFPTIRGLPNRR